MNNIFTLIIYLIPVAIGLYFFYFKEGPLYFKLLFFAVACYPLEELYNIVYLAAIGEMQYDFSFASFAIGACFLFLFSANYGQFDSLVDDGSSEYKSSRKIGVIVPVVLVILFAFASIKYLENGYAILFIILNFLCKLPGFFAAYLHLKHLVILDKDHFLVDTLRPCNFMCLLFILLVFVQDLAYSMMLSTFANVLHMLIPLALIGMMLTAERGRKKWKI